jgi:transposase
MIRNAPKGAAVYGVDLGKSLFHVACLDGRGAVAAREVSARYAARLLRTRRAHHCRHGGVPGSQWLARKLQAIGHQVRIVPAQFVKPYVKSRKNDTLDAEASRKL